MSKDWYYSEGNQAYQKWFRATNQRIECPLGGLPIFRADIDECVVRGGDEPVLTRLGTVEIDATNLLPEEITKAVQVQEFLTALIEKHAAPLIEARLGASTSQP